MFFAPIAGIHYREAKLTQGHEWFLFRELDLADLLLEQVYPLFFPEPCSLYLSRKRRILSIGLPISLFCSLNTHWKPR